MKRNNFISTVKLGYECVCCHQNQQPHATQSKSQPHSLWRRKLQDENLTEIKGETEKKNAIPKSMLMMNRFKILIKTQPNKYVKRDEKLSAFRVNKTAKIRFSLCYLTTKTKKHVHSHEFSMISIVAICSLVQLKSNVAPYLAWWKQHVHMMLA